MAHYKCCKRKSMNEIYGISTGTKKYPCNYIVYSFDVNFFCNDFTQITESDTVSIYVKVNSTVYTYTRRLQTNKMNVFTIFDVKPVGAIVTNFQVYATTTAKGVSYRSPKYYDSNSNVNVFLGLIQVQVQTRVSALF